MADAYLKGKLPTDLANAVSEAMGDAMTRGMAADEACYVVAAVAADYLRANYCDARLAGLAETVRRRSEHPLPTKVPL